MSDRGGFTSDVAGVAGVAAFDQNWRHANDELDRLLVFHQEHRALPCADLDCTGRRVRDALFGLELHQLRMVLVAAVERLNGWRQRHPIAPLDGARRAVHLLTAAQREVRRHMDKSGADRDAAESALIAKTDAAILAADAAPVLLAYLDDLAGKLLALSGKVGERIEREEDPGDVLNEFHEAVSALARDVRA